MTSDLDRRKFLLGAVGAAAGVATIGLPGLSKANAEVSLFPESGIATSNPFEAAPSGAGYVVGQLKQVSRDRIVVSAIHDNQHYVRTYRLTADTEIHRRTFTDTWRDLRVADRVDCSFYAASRGTETARFIWANGIALWGEVVGVDGATLIVESIANYDPNASGDIYQLEVTPETRMLRLDGTTDAGNVDLWSVGDYMHFTAATDSPDPTVHKAWALVLNQAEMGIDEA